MKFLFISLFLFFINISGFTQPISDEVKKSSIDKISTMLKENYVFEDVAEECGQHIKNKLSEGSFKDVNDAKAFSELLTKELQSISHDKHMRVRVRPPQQQQANNDPNPFLENFINLRELQSSNYGIAKVERLEGNIGYLDLRFFPDISLVKDQLSAAMKLLYGSDAIIFDLRKNRGGSPTSIRYICSYLFENPTHLNSLYYRKENRTEEFWTNNDIVGDKISDVPVFVLTSSSTFSGGEEFANNIKTQKRGLIIGETTGGGANPGGMFPVNEHIVIFIPTGKAINPITKSNWEGVGVIPDIQTTEADAFNTAYEKAKNAASEYKDKSLNTYQKLTSDLIKDLNPIIKTLANEESSSAENQLNTILDKAAKNKLINEESVNQLGYQFLFENNINMAIAIFKYNAVKYPDSWNVYDSLGEAYLKKGNKKAAKENYSISVKLNPENKNGAEIIKTLNN